ncbi:MAG: cysteine desulfurase family protein [Gammaproteobacteria bacterium]|nr:cysteine desulfurase family protein [Gammaproteobacteria bacterium]
MTVYFDYNATSPLDPAVLEAMLPFLRQPIGGNASSRHAPGRAARAAVERAREQVAALVGAAPREIVFTSGGTEANNLAIKGIAATWRSGSLLVSAIEHSSVLAPARALAAAGWRILEVLPDEDGRIPPERVSAALAPDTRLVSIMWANNETGVIQDVAACAALTGERGVAFHSDAVQAAGKVPVDTGLPGLGLASLSAHKIGGPQGVGALVVDSALDLEPLLHGGGQEGGRRSGTENVAGIVGFGQAAELAAARLGEARRLAELRTRLEQGLSGMPGVEIFGAQAERLPNTVFFAVDGVDGSTLLLLLDEAGYAVSSGSACGSGRPEPSHVLLAMGAERERAFGALRVSLGAGNRAEEVDGFVAVLAERVRLLRGMAV